MRRIHIIFVYNYKKKTVYLFRKNKIKKKDFYYSELKKESTKNKIKMRFVY